MSGFGRAVREVQAAPQRHAQHQAQAQAEERQSLARMIDALYDSPARQGEIAGFGDTMLAQLMQRLTRGRTDAERDTRHGLARQGLIGGSAHRDAAVSLGELFAGGVNEAVLETQRAMAGLRAGDEEQRLGMHAMAGSADPTQALQHAGNLQLATMHGAAPGQRVADLGNLFAGVAQVYGRQHQAGARQAAERDVRSSLYGGGPR